MRAGHRILALGVVLLAGCGSAGFSGASAQLVTGQPTPGGSPSGSSSVSPSRSSSSDPTEVTVAVVKGGRLVEPLTYDSGLLRFDPPHAQDPDHPPVSPAAAEATFAATMGTLATEGSHRQEFLARMSDYGGSGGRDRLVWVIRSVGAELTGSGPGPAAPGVKATTPLTAAASPHDVVAIVDATSGVQIEVLEDVADSPAHPAP